NEIRAQSRRSSLPGAAPRRRSCCLGSRDTAARANPSGPPGHAQAAIRTPPGAQLTSLIAQIKRLAEQFLPLLLLPVAQECLNPTLVLLPDLHDLGPDSLGITAGLGLLDHGLDLFLQFLYHGHALLSLLVRELQLFADVGPGQQGKQSLLL